MKRSPPPPLPLLPPANSSSSSSSSSYSYLNKCPPPAAAVAEDNQRSQPEKVRPKRTRRNRTATDLKLAVSSPSGSNNKRSSIYRGVTRHRWTGRFEAHLWDKGSWNNIQKKKGRQVYLGAYDSEEAAAHTYDLAALKHWGPKTTLNFPIETYSKELKEMQKVSKEEYLASLRRQSNGFSRGVSKYRGVARHHHNGRWEARIGRVYGNKYLYLGTYNTQEEAAEAYDMAAIEYRGANAVTNFDISNYIDRLKQRAISLDRVLQEPTPNSSAVSEEAEPEVEQPRQKQQDDQEQEKAATQQDFPPCMETNNTVIPMDPIGEHELNWNFCMETAGMPQLPVPEFTLQNACDQLPDLFDDTGFDELSDFIFDTGSFEKKELNLEYLSDNNIAGNGAEEIVIPENAGEEEEEYKKEKDMVLSSSSSFSSTPCNNAASSGSPSSCSTTTSVSFNYSA